MSTTTDDPAAPAAAAASPAFGYVPALDGLRAVAVCCVVGFHARGTTFPGGYIGVDLFFVLSGFLITSILLVEHRTTGRIAFGRFYLRRSLRLLPAVLLLCAVVAPACWVFPHLPERTATLRGALTAATYTSSPVAAAGVPLGSMLHTWSLSVEEYFYFVWPVLLVLVLSRLPRRLGRALVVLVLAAVAYRWWAAYGAGWEITRIAYAPDTRAEQLLIGCALAVLLPRLRPGRGVGLVPALVAGVVLAGFVVLRGDRAYDAYYYGGSTVAALLAAMLVAHVVGRPGSPLTRALALPPLRWIGQRSYGIYLWNVPVVTLVALAPWGGGPQLAVKLGLTFVVPALSYRFLEVPVRRLGNRHPERPAVPPD